MYIFSISVIDFSICFKDRHMLFCQILLFISPMLLCKSVNLKLFKNVLSPDQPRQIYNLYLSYLSTQASCIQYQYINYILYIGNLKKAIYIHILTKRKLKCHSHARDVSRLSEWVGVLEWNLVVCPFRFVWVNFIDFLFINCYRLKIYFLSLLFFSERFLDLSDTLLDIICSKVKLYQ